MYLLASAPKQKHDWLARMTLMGLAWVPRSELGYAFRSSQSTSIDVNCVSNLCSIVCFWILCALAHPLRCGFNQELPPCDAKKCFSDGGFGYVCDVSLLVSPV